MNNTIELKNKLIEELKAAGADIVSFGNVEKFRDPAVKELFPNAKTCIGIACRILRGSKRGIEEGSTYYQYSAFIETIEEIIIPGILLKGANILEEAGFLAFPQRRTQLIVNGENKTNFEVNYHEVYDSRGKEILLDFDKCAVDSNLGEIGLSGSLLTDEFGPNQRICFILTDAVLPEDPAIKPHLCDNCKECIKACPGHALNKDGKRNSWQCAAYYKGANRSRNPFMPPDTFADDPDRLAIIAGEADLTPEHAREIIDQINFYPPNKHAFVASMCGRMCDTACYVHLEEKGVLNRKFKTPFRKRPTWYLPEE